MTGAQPNPIQEQVAETQYGNDTGFAAQAADPQAEDAQADPNPEFTGDMPDDPEQARTYRPGQEDNGAG